MDRQEISAVLASAGLRPRHEFGQNFMVDQALLRAIADAGEIGEQDVVLEVGPGVGNLTRLLAQRATRGAVLAVDIDRKLLPAAARHHAELKNVTWLLADALAGKHAIAPALLEKLRELRALHPAGKLKLVSNLPYNAASPLVAELLVEMWRDAKSYSPGLARDNEVPYSPGLARDNKFANSPGLARDDEVAYSPGLARDNKFANSPGLARDNAADPGESIAPARKPGHHNAAPDCPGDSAALFFERLAFTVQWEVGRRMAAHPDTRDYGPLGILIQLLGQVEILRKIPPGAFWPPPKISSALLVVKPNLPAMRRVADAPRLQNLLAGIFAHRRQTLANALKHFLRDQWTDPLKDALTAAGFDLTLRPEIFTPAKFSHLEELMPAGALERAR